MRIAFGATFVIVASIAAACGGRSDDGLFSDGGSAGTTGSTSGGSGASATGGLSGSGGFGGTGAASVGGTFGSGGFGGGSVDGSLEDGADAGGSGGSFGTDGGGTSDSGGSGPDGGGNDGVRCDGSTCGADQQCCVSSNRQNCTATGSQCSCGLGCNAAAVTCDSQSDCQNGQVCCYNVVLSPISAYVSSVRCQATCNNGFTQYVLCEEGGPDVCTGNTSCSQALLMPSGYFVCQ